MPKLSVTQRLDQHDQQLSKHDREIAAIRRLILAGMRMLHEASVLHRENQKAAKEFRKDLQRLERKVEALTDSLLQGRNGHNKRSEIR
jgi:cell division protein ZapA (FtsZ GTPase activity inhibitor)